jgi:hypothetical protein
MCGAAPILGRNLQLFLAQSHDDAMRHPQFRKQVEDIADPVLDLPTRVLDHGPRLGAKEPDRQGL